MFKFLFLVAFSVISVNGQSVSVGGCPAVKALSPFNWGSFNGKWYTNSRIPSSWDLTGKCILDVYSNLTAANPSMNYSHYDMQSNALFTDVGVISIPNNTVGEYKITFPKAQMGQSLTVKIIATDYTGYALAYGCFDLGVARMEFAWVKTRGRFVFPWITDPAYAAYDTLKLNRTLMIPVDAVSCPAY